MRHLLYIAMGVALALSLRLIPMAFLERISRPLMALSVLTISDHLLRDEALPPEDRERSFGDMVEIALEAAFA